MAKERYQAAEYWERLLSSNFTIAGVAHPYLPHSFNGFLYRAMERSMHRALRTAPLAQPVEASRVLDVGSGVGLWLAFWRRLGVSRLTSIDLTEASAQRLAALYPEVRVEQADIASADLAPLGRFELVSVVNVLLHLTDDDSFASALGNLASVLEPGGALVVIDPVVAGRSRLPRPDESANSKARSLEQWREALSLAHLRLVQIFPVTVLLDGPVEARTAASFRARMWLWNTLCRGLCGRERRGAVVGGLLYAIDSALIPLTRTGPSLKCLVIAAE